MLSGGAVEVRSAGSAPADSINPAVHEAMLEAGIDLSAEAPKVLTTEAVQASDVVITMGCGDACPIFPAKRYEDWQLEDPAGRGSSPCGRSGTTSSDVSASCSPRSTCPSGRAALTRSSDPAMRRQLCRNVRVAGRRFPTPSRRWPATGGCIE